MSYNSRAYKPPFRHPAPLIYSAKNAWAREKWDAFSAEELELLLSDVDDESFRTPPEHLFSSPSPKTRRHILLVVLWLLCVWILYSYLFTPWALKIMEDRAVGAAIVNSVSGNLSAHVQAEFDGLVLLQDLDEKYVPSIGKSKHHKHSAEGRLVIVGDVHGMKESLVKLLEKVKFDTKKDHLVLAGDMISKGPDSLGVLDLVMELGATAVRGNHEDRIILAYDKLHARNTNALVAKDNSEEGARSQGRKGEEKDAGMASQLKHKHIQWLKKCPIILRVGNIEGMGEVVVVHAGLVPGQALEKQDPWFVMNMRTMDLDTSVPSDLRDGTPWTKFWNKYQESLPKHKRSTVIYGHDSKRGLNVKKYSKGIDTGCLKGGELTALVIEGGHQEVTQRLVHVKCHDLRQ